MFHSTEMSFAKQKHKSYLQAYDPGKTSSTEMILPLFCKRKHDMTKKLPNTKLIDKMNYVKRIIGITWIYIYIYIYIYYMLYKHIWIIYYI